MEENQTVKDAVEEIKAVDENQLKEIIEKWFESTRTDGMKLGAYFISAGVFAAIQKHIKKSSKPSLRDYQRMTDDIIKIVSVQIKQNETQQNDSEQVQEEEV